MTDSLIELNLDTLADFVPLFVSVFNQPPWNDGWSPEAAHERLSAFARFPQFHGLGLLRDGVPVALVLGWGERWVDGWTFHVKEMCVQRELQGQGTGGRLLSALEQRLRERGFVSIYLQTGSQAAARGFYERGGYALEDYVSLGKML